jgi:hypothetical protein
MPFRYCAEPTSRKNLDSEVLAEQADAMSLKQLDGLVDLRHVMKKKPDLLMVLMFVFGIGMVASGYTFDNPDPELVASQFSIR